MKVSEIFGQNQAFQGSVGINGISFDLVYYFAFFMQLGEKRKEKKTKQTKQQTC